MGVLFETPRLRAVAAADSDLDRLLEVYLSRPDVLELTEGSAGAAGHYDRGMLERDLALADLDPTRTAAALVRDGRVVGAMDWLDSHPLRGIPWIGMLMIGAAHERQGLGREALAGLVRRGAGEGWTAVGMGAVDERCSGFLAALGFTPTGAVNHRFAGGEREVRLFELQLEASGRLLEVLQNRAVEQDEAD